MTLHHRHMNQTDKTFLRHGPNQKTGLAQQQTASRETSELQTPRPVVEPAIINTIQTWDRFCALSIKVDLDAGQGIPQVLDASLLALLDVAQKEHQAVGCRWAEGLFFCALKDADVDTAEKFAREFQTQLSGLRPDTVTIGIAPYPQLNFSRGQILTNTCKALDHAAFFGPGSAVSFDAVSLNISGDKHYRADDLELAAAEYRSGLELDPRNANLHNSLGICLAKQGDVAAAKDTFHRALEIEPAETMAVYNLGVVALLQENPDQALARFQEAYALDREIFEIPYQIGQVLTEKENWPTALEYLDSAIAIDDSHWQLFNLKGNCLAKLGDRAKAIQAYGRSVKINPNNAEGLSALGCLYDECDENPEICEAFFQQSISLNPQNGLFHHRLGRWHQKNRQFDLAMAAYLQASALGFDASQEIADLEKSDGDVAAPTTRCA